MKNIKQYTLMLLGLLFFVACSDDDNPISSSFVSFSKGQIEVKETHGIFKVPITVTGEHSNDIKVVVAAEPGLKNPAEQNTNFIITSEEITIPAGVNEVEVEIRTKDDHKMNENRKFYLNIDRVEGAKLGNITTAKITLIDNDSNPYERFFGKWSINYQFIGRPTEGDNPVNMFTNGHTVLQTEGSPGYNKFFHIKFDEVPTHPFYKNQDGKAIIDIEQKIKMSLKFQWSYDEDQEEGHLFMVCNMANVGNAGKFGYAAGGTGENRNWKVECQWETNKEGDITRIYTEKDAFFQLYFNYPMDDFVIPILAGQLQNIEFIKAE